MAYIPKNAQWYVADLVEEIHVTGRKRQTAWINTVLIRADSPAEAHKKAMEVGKSGETKYKSMNGQTVRCRFRGIHELNVIHEKLEHGCEIFFRSKPSMTEKGIKRLVGPKQDLAVFRDITPQNINAHFPAHIATELDKRRKTKQKQGRKSTTP